MTTPNVIEAQESLRIPRQIERASTELKARFSSKLKLNSELTRALVSFQANKKLSGYRWFKFKEGFSYPLVEYVLNSLSVFSGKIIDPFAGSGTALFAASVRGMDAVGIEVLPIGCEIIRARKAALQNRRRITAAIQEWIKKKPWRNSKEEGIAFPHLRITAGAFSGDNEKQLESYLAALGQIRDKATESVLRLAVLSILEQISYTRKDGQYLRWDYRSGRCLGEKKFDKGKIEKFDDAIVNRLGQFSEDLEHRHDFFDQMTRGSGLGKIDVISGSCLEELPRLPSNSFDALITSPPYCNRYDYTRTYALELALLGTSEDLLRTLRQRMLSCTVENKEKGNLKEFYGSEDIERAEEIFESQKTLRLICEYLEKLRDNGLLNNPGILRMVRNYFWEMTLVIMECARILKPNAPLVMVNDNVRYAGVAIPVDLILSSIAEQIGFDVEAIWTLPIGKGNSSQQMGEHGREELRKCVYIWRTTKAKQAKRKGLELALQQ